MRRLKSDEDGATAVMIALLLVPIFVATAFVVDMGLIYWEARQLQNGADAAALAIAQDCAAGDVCTSAAGTPTAQQYADANANDDASAVLDVAIPGDNGPNSVSVTTGTRSDAGDSFLTHAFSRVIGIDTTTWQRTATAAWGVFGGGATLPLTFSECEWDFMTGGDLNNLPTAERTIYFHSSQTAASINTCGGPANQDHPGGFGWLDTTGDGCSAIVHLGVVHTNVGNSVPSDCSEEFFNNLLGGDPVLVPIFSEIVNPQGNNADYRIVGYAAMEVIGYRFSGSKYNEPTGDVPCSGNDRCIRGRFVNYYDLGSEPAVGGPEDFGAYVVGLTG